MKFSIMGCILLFVALKTGDISGNTAINPSTPSTNSTENSTVSTTLNDYSTVNSTVNDNSTDSSTLNDYSTVNSTVNDNSTDSYNVNDNSTDSSTVNDNSTDSSNVNDNSTDSYNVNDNSTDSSTVNDNSTDSSNVNDNSTDSSTVNDNSTDSSNINDTSSTSSIANVNNTTTTYESTNAAPTYEYNTTEYTTVTTYETTNDASCYEQNSTVPTGITLWFPEIEDLNGTLVASFNCTEDGCIVKKNLTLNSTFVAVKKQPWSTNTPCAESIKTILKQTEISEFQNGDSVMFYCAGGAIRRPSGGSLTLNSELSLKCDDMGSWWCELENSTDVLSLNISVRCPIQLTSALNEPTIPVSTYLLYNIPVVGYPLHATFHLLMSEVTCGTRTDVTVADDVYNVSLQTTGDPRSGNVTLRIPVIKDEYLTNWTLLINNSVGQPLVIRFKLVSKTGAEHSASCDDQPDISSIIIIAVPTALSIFIVIVLIIVIVAVCKRKKQTRRANEMRARRFDIVEPEQKSRSRDAESVNFDRQVSLTSFTGSCHSIPADDNFSLDSLSGRNGLHDIGPQDDKQLSPVNSGKFAFHQNNHADHSQVTLAPPAESTPPVPEKKKRSRKHGISHVDDVNPYNFPRNSNAVRIQGSQEAFAVV